MTPFLYRHPIEAHTVAPELTDAERADVERFAAAPAFVGGDAADDFASDRADAISRDHDEIPGLDGYDQVMWP